MSVTSLQASENKVVNSSGQNLQEYARMCTQEIGQIPASDCTVGEVVPITVNGKAPKNYTTGMSCDRPALLPYDSKTFGQCTPYSRIHNLSALPDLLGL